MLKDFWEKNKHQIQLTGILTGVGALFLSIPNPEVEVASVVLQKIQFVWLIIVTVSVALLFYNLYTLLKLYEDKNKEDKEGFHFDETISLIIFATIFYFVMNMWIYTYSLYKEAFFSFIVIAYYGITAFFVAIAYHCWRKFVLKFEKSPTSFRIAMAILGHIANSFFLGAWFSFSTSGWRFVWINWLYWSLGFFLFILVMIIIEYLSDREKLAIKQNKINKSV